MTIVIEVAELTTKLMTGMPSIVTDVEFKKFVPVIVEVVPPAIDPEAGDIDVKVGIAGVMKLATGLNPAKGAMLPGGELTAADW